MKFSPVLRYGRMTAIDLGPTSWLALAADPSYSLLADLAAQPTLSADINLGDNDDSTPGQYEFGVGDSVPSDMSAGQRVWDPAADLTLDSGWVDVHLALSAGGGTGGVTLSVGGDGVTYDRAAYGHILGLQVRAYAYGPDRSFEWQNLRFEFYHNGVADQTITVDDGPRASTYGGNDLSSSENYINVSAPSTDDDAVIVRAQVHLTVGQMPVFAGEDVSGQINLFATQPTSG